MFRRINSRTEITPREEVTFKWNNVELVAREGDTIAAALLASGVTSNRNHPVSTEPRAAYCMMGVCFECLVEVDGVPNRQACQVRLRKGMIVKVQNGARA